MACHTKLDVLCVFSFRNEFLKFLKYIVFFDNLYDKFVAIDSDSDHRLTEAEFVKGWWNSIVPNCGQELTAEVFALST